MFHKFILIYSGIIHGYITNSQYEQLPVGLIAQSGRALHRHRRGHGLESLPSLFFFFFFQAFFSELLKLRK